MTVDECIREEEHALLGVEDVHSGECAEFRTYADNLLCHLDGVGVFGVQSGDECVSIACLYHHHTEVVALVHLIVSLLKGVALTSTLLGKMLCVCGTSALLLIGTHVNQFNTVEIKLQALSHTTQAVGVAQKNRVAEAFGLGLNSSLHH